MEERKINDNKVTENLTDENLSQVNGGFILDLPETHNQFTAGKEDEDNHMVPRPDHIFY